MNVWFFYSFSKEILNGQWPMTNVAVHIISLLAEAKSDLFHGNIFRWLQRPLTCCLPFPHGDPQSILAWDIILRKFHHFCVISMAWWLNGYRKLLTKIISKDLLPVPDLFPSTQVEFDTIPVGPLVDLCFYNLDYIDKMNRTLSYWPIGRPLL